MPASATLTIRTLFAPFDDTTQAFLEFVGRAKKSLEINIYGFHLPQLTDLLLQKQQQGVKISIILDHTQADGRAEASEVQKLIDGKVPLLIGTSPVHHAILHAKFCVVDGAAVQHGSWNYSLSASQQSNDMHFVEDPAYARSYQDHHNAIRSFIVLHEMTMQPQGETPAAQLSIVSTGEQDGLEQAA
jgi:phosphatidylserine/phosphatidylglycerophosphate/cardiolipin synthase-like enzyme